jgi:hypothetical protein
VRINRRRRDIEVEEPGVGVYDPTTGEIRFARHCFVRHAQFSGPGDQAMLQLANHKPYRVLPSVITAWLR